MSDPFYITRLDQLGGEGGANHLSLVQPIIGGGGGGGPSFALISAYPSFPPHSRASFPTLFSASFTHIIYLRSFFPIRVYKSTGGGRRAKSKSPLSGGPQPPMTITTLASSTTRGCPGYASMSCLRCRWVRSLLIHPLLSIHNSESYTAFHLCMLPSGEYRDCEALTFSQASIVFPCPTTCPLRSICLSFARLTRTKCDRKMPSCNR